MAGEEDALGRCTAEQKAPTCEESFSTKHTPEGCTTQHKSATDGEPRTTEPQAADGGINEAGSEPQTQTEEAEHPDGYEDEADDDYQDDAEHDEDDYDYESGYESEYDYEPLFSEYRPKVRAALLTFPEAAGLQPHELDAAVERVLEQSKPEHAAVAAPGKIRLLKEDIEMALHQWTPPPPAMVHGWFSKPKDESLYPAVLIRRWEELDSEYLSVYGEADEEHEWFRAMVRGELLEKGYVEVDEDYYEKKDEFEWRMTLQLEEEWKQIDFSRFRVANNEDGICYYSEEHGGYI